MIKPTAIVLLCFQHENTHFSIPTITQNQIYKQYLIIKNYNIHHITLMRTS